MPRFSPRKRLYHEVPGWVPTGALFFITVCTKKRRANFLATPEVAPILIESVAHRHENGTWFVRLFLVMPDHVHVLVAVPSDRDLGMEISAWKRFTAKRAGIAWQDGFFEHRMRAGEQFDLKHRYIRENPVRAGLVKESGDWLWFWAPDGPAFLE